jgi:hypothetical protein
MKPCTYCGRENDEGSVRCFECGTELEAQQEIMRPPRKHGHNEGLQLRPRVALGIVAGLQLSLFLALYFVGALLEAVFHGGFQIGPPPPRLYSPAWGESLLLLSIITCFYHLLVALGIWGRWPFRIGVLLHVGLATCFVLCGIYAHLDAWVFPLFLGPALWSFYATRFAPSAIAA